MDFIDASSVYEQWAEEQCGGYNFGKYMSDWVAKQSAETEKPRQRVLFLLRRSSSGVEFNNRPISSVPTIGDWWPQLQHDYLLAHPLKTEEISTEEEISRIYQEFVMDHAGGLNYERFTKDWIDKNSVPLCKDRRPQQQNPAPPPPPPVPTIGDSWQPEDLCSLEEWWPLCPLQDWRPFEEWTKEIEW